MAGVTLTKIKKVSVNTHEGALSSKVAKWARDSGFMEVKLSGGQGWPDRLFVLPNGIICFVEFKSPNILRPRPRPRQKLIMDMLLNLNIPVLLTNDFEEAKEWLKFLCGRGK